MKSIFIAEINDYPIECIEWVIEDLEDMGFGWEWTKDCNIKYWLK